jgi:hypothetical protein
LWLVEVEVQDQVQAHTVQALVVLFIVQHYL